jgi:hypothetical protein
LADVKRIVVAGDEDTVSPQARTYAEYRVFAVVARHTRHVQRVRVLVERIHGNTGCERLKCGITVDLEQAGMVSVAGTGPHTCAAINRAVERLGPALERRLEVRPSS